MVTCQSSIELYPHPGKDMTVGMIQMLKQKEESDKILDSFGIIIVNECHHIPAKTIRETMTHISCYCLFFVYPFAFKGKLI